MAERIINLDSIDYDENYYVEVDGVGLAKSRKVPASEFGKSAADAAAAAQAAVDDLELRVSDNEDDIAAHETRLLQIESGGIGTSSGIDGGAPDSVYTADQIIDGGLIT